MAEGHVHLMVARKRGIGGAARTVGETLLGVKKPLSGLLPLSCGNAFGHCGIDYDDPTCRSYFQAC